MEFAIAKISTKGQIVIPSQLRKGIINGDEFLMIRDKGRIVLKNMKELAFDLREDILFAEKVDLAWQDYDKGNFVKKSKADFIKELKSC